MADEELNQPDVQEEEEEDLYPKQHHAFTKRQRKLLKGVIDERLKKKRDAGGGRKVTFIEGHTAIDQANRIFEHGNWAYQPISCNEKVIRDPLTDTPVGVAYEALVELTVQGCHHIIVEKGWQSVSTWNVRDAILSTRKKDLKNGRKVALDAPHEPDEIMKAQTTISDAHEVAAKGAVTDGLKRALRTFGDQFGNGLYGDGRVHFPDEDEDDGKDQTSDKKEQAQQQQQQQVKKVPVALPPMPGMLPPTPTSTKAPQPTPASSPSRSTPSAQTTSSEGSEKKLEMTEAFMQLSKEEQETFKTIWSLLTVPERKEFLSFCNLTVPSNEWTVEIYRALLANMAEKTATEEMKEKVYALAKPYPIASYNALRGRLGGTIKEKRVPDYTWGDIALVYRILLECRPLHDLGVLDDQFTLLKNNSDFNKVDHPLDLFKIEYGPEKRKLYLDVLKGLYQTSTNARNKLSKEVRERHHEILAAWDKEMQPAA